MTHVTGWAMGAGAAVGLSLLLVGLRVLSGELSRAVHPSMRAGISGRASPVAGFFPGLFFAGVMQSSSAVAATSVALVHGGVLTFERAFAVILGANVGTTLTAHLGALSFSLWPYTLSLILCGLAVRSTGSIAIRAGRRGAGRVRPYGAALSGLGAMLMGLQLLGTALTPLMHHPLALELVRRAADHPALSILAGAAVTAVVQSSSAVSATVVQLSAAGSIPVETSLSIVLGSNIGTVATTLLAATGLSSAAKKTAVADLLFNVAGVCLALLLFPWFVSLLRLLSPDPGQRVAHAHTLFNAATAAAALPLLGHLTRLVDGIVRADRRD